MLSGGVSGGTLTREVLDELFVVFDLNEQEKKSVLSYLQEENIIPVSEDDIPQKPLESEAVTQTKLDEVDESEAHGVFFERAFKKYEQAVQDEPRLATLYESEIPIFIKAVLNPEDGSNAISGRIAFGCVAVGYDRVCRVKKGATVCGTYISHVCDQVEAWVKRTFTEKELTELFECFVSSRELTSEQTNMVKLLLHNCPRIIVRPVVPPSFFGETP